VEREYAVACGGYFAERAFRIISFLPSPHDGEGGPLAVDEVEMRVIPTKPSLHDGEGGPLAVDEVV